MCSVQVVLCCVCCTGCVMCCVDCVLCAVQVVLYQCGYCASYSTYCAATLEIYKTCVCSIYMNLYTGMYRPPRKKSNSIVI